jgi:hypothetical protein
MTLACAAQLESEVEGEANGVNGWPVNGLPAHARYPMNGVVVGVVVIDVVVTVVVVVVVVMVVMEVVVIEVVVKEVVVSVVVVIVVVVVGVVVCEVVGEVAWQSIPNPPSSKKPSNMSLISAAEVEQSALATTSAVPKHEIAWASAPSGPLNSVAAALNASAAASHAG